MSGKPYVNNKINTLEVNLPDKWYCNLCNDELPISKFYLRRNKRKLKFSKVKTYLYPDCYCKTHRAEVNNNWKNKNNTHIKKYFTSYQKNRRKTDSEFREKWSKYQSEWIKNKYHSDNIFKEKYKKYSRDRYKINKKEICKIQSIYYMIRCISNT